MKLKLRYLFATVIALVIYIPVVQAQANLTFSGGNISPLNITLRQSVRYEIINPACNNVGPLFVFNETGDAFDRFGSKARNNDLFH